MNVHKNVRLATIQGAGTFLVNAFHYLALFVIGGSIVWSAIVG